MALAETARLVVDLSLKGNFARDLRKTSGALGQFEARVDKAESRAFRAGQQIGTGIKRGAAIAAVGVGILALNVERGLQSLIDLEAQTDITNAAIKSTGGIAGVTATEVRAMAEEFESVNALFGDEVIQSAANMLLAFTNIRKKAFKPTLQAVLDLNAGLGKGPEGLVNTAKLLGIALNDPEKGLTRLSRAGVTFTKEQIKRIKGLQKEGKLYEAQAIILAEVNKRFGGRGAAFGGETAKKVAKFHDAIEDLQRTLAVGLLPVVGNIADALSELFADPAIQKGVADFGQDLAKVLSAKNIKAFISDIRDFAVLVAPGIRAAAGAVGLLAGAFAKLPPDLRNLLIGAIAVNKLTGGLVTNIAGGLASAIGGALKTIVAGNVTVIGKSVIGPGGIPGAPVPGAPGAPGGPGGGGVSVPKIGAAIAIDLKALQSLPSIARTLERIQNRPIRPQQSPDARDRAVTAKMQQIADVFVRANADRAGERGARGRAPGASTETQNNIRELANKLTPIDANTGTVIPGAINRLQTSSLASIQALGTNVTTTGQATKQATTTGSQVVSSATRSAAFSNAAIVAGATRASASAIIGAIYAARPIINTTHITRNTTVQQRYGPGNGSAGQNGPGASGV